MRNTVIGEYHKLFIQNIATPLLTMFSVAYLFNIRFFPYNLYPHARFNLTFPLEFESLISPAHAPN